MADLAPVDPAPALRLDLDPDPSVEALVRGMTHSRFLGEHGDPDRAAAAARSFVERVLPQARHLVVREVDGGEAHGSIWLVVDGDDLAVLSFTLDDHRRASHVRELTLDLARDEGFRRLTLGVAPGDPGHEQFVHGRDFEVAAFQMRLDLDHALPGEDLLALVPMDSTAYDVYLGSFVGEYAETREKAGESPARAREVAEEQMAFLLPQGLATPDHHFFVGHVDGERVGTLWMGTERPLAFVYDVVVDEAYRRRGHGAALMRAGALWAQARGAHALGLNVFGYNRGAKALYDRLGYHVVEELAAHTIEPRS